MSNGITVVGMVSAQHVIEDINVVVPYRVAVQIPGVLVLNSGDLQEALVKQKVMKLSGSLPSGAVFRGGPIQRAGAPNPMPSRNPPSNGAEVKDLKAQVQRLIKDLADSKAREVQAQEREKQLQDLNQSLQTTLSVMSGQLTTIQAVLEELKKEGITVMATGLVSKGSLEASGVEDDVPMFITSVKDDDAKVNISVAAQASNTDLAASRTALKNLRKSNKA